MTRLLLTLLALFTGLAAQVSPAHARMVGSGETEIGAAQSHSGGARVAARAVQALGFAPKRALPQRTDVRARLPHIRVFIATVQLGSDRSLD